MHGTNPSTRNSKRCGSGLWLLHTSLCNEDLSRTNPIRFWSYRYSNNPTLIHIPSIRTIITYGKQNDTYIRMVWEPNRRMDNDHSNTGERCDIKISHTIILPYTLYCSHSGTATDEAFWCILSLGASRVAQDTTTRLCGLVRAV